MMAEVGVSISGMPGPPLGPSYLQAGRVKQCDLGVMEMWHGTNCRKGTDLGTHYQLPVRCSSLLSPSNAAQQGRKKQPPLNTSSKQAALWQ
jgi:hypothetical protein